jgi:hypothetical protein
MGWGFVCCVATRVVVVVKQTETSMAAVGTGRAFHFLHRRPSCGLLWLWVGWALTAERRETEWRRARRSLSVAIVLSCPVAVAGHTGLGQLARSASSSGVWALAGSLARSLWQTVPPPISPV